jgi:8-oxo-dGTP diphosphatase
LWHDATNTKIDHQMKDDTRYPMPFTRVELCIFAFVAEELCVLQVRREAAPAKGKWALPGGVLRIDLDHDLESAAQRVATERLGTCVPYLRLQTAVGGKARDPRAPWTLSIAYRGTVREDALAASPGKRVEALRWAGAEAAALDVGLAFDHSHIIAAALEDLRGEVDNLELPWGLLPAEFTLAELQRYCEAVLGRPLDKSSFRRRLGDRDCVEQVPGRLHGAAHRPAQVYRARQ